VRQPTPIHANRCPGRAAEALPTRGAESASHCRQKDLRKPDSGCNSRLSSRCGHGLAAKLHPASPRSRHPPTSGPSTRRYLMAHLMARRRAPAGLANTANARPPRRGVCPARGSALVARPDLGEICGRSCGTPPLRDTRCEGPSVGPEARPYPERRTGDQAPLGTFPGRTIRRTAYPSRYGLWRMLVGHRAASDLPGIRTNRKMPASEHFATISLRATAKTPPLAPGPCHEMLDGSCSSWPSTRRDAIPR
jgi:hypothetical protein